MDINDLTYQINGAVFEVNRELGSGFLEIHSLRLRNPFSLPMSAERKV
jgi:hypothetical protein